MRLCSGCRTKVANDVRFCDACKLERGTPVVSDGIREHTLTDRERYAFLYKSERWKRSVSPKMLKRYPFCCMCEAAMSTLVDHKVPAGVAIVQAQESGKYPFSKWAGFYLLSNLWALCRSCHFKKTIEDKAHVGPWPNVVEVEAAQPRKVWSF